jgi:hypothetical protein
MTDRRLDELLSEGRLSGPTRDRILEAALTEIQAEKPRPAWRRILAWALPLSTAMAAVALFVALRPSEFRARGGAGPVLELGCRDGALTACPAGSTLLFRAGGAVEGGFLAAWAEPAGGGERVWYFPAEGGESPSLVPRADLQTLPRGIRIGAEQPPGRYRVHLVLSRRPLDRAAAAAPPADARLAEAELTLEVVR